MVKVGIVGTKRAKVFTEPIAALEYAEVSAICGRTTESAEKAASDFGIPSIWTDHKEMFRESDIAAVIVATPDHLHHSMTADALECGLHVLCEKPMALNADEANEMNELALAKGLKNQIYFSWRSKPEFAVLNDLLTSNEIGKWYDFQLCWLCGKRLGDEESPFHKYYESALKPWRMDKGTSNGVIGDFGSHVFDMIQFRMSPVHEISASAVTRRPVEKGVCPVESLSAVLGLENGAHGAVTLSEIANAKPELRLIVCGEKGHIRIRSGLGDSEVTLSHGDHEDELAVKTDSSDPGTRDITEVFVESILNNTNPVPTFADGLSVQRVIDGALESDAMGLKVVLT